MIMKKYFKARHLIFSLLISFSVGVFAQCVENNAADNLNVSFPNSITVGNEDTPLGKVLATVTLSHSVCLPLNGSLSETSIGPSLSSQVVSSGQKQMLNVIPTNIEGVGLRWVTRVNGQEIIMTAGGMLNTAQDIKLNHSGQAVTFTEQFELVKIGRINPVKKSLSINDIVMQRKNPVQKSIIKDLYNIRFAPIALYKETCTAITIPTVQLGSVSSSVFKSGKGAASLAVPFNLNYKNCPATADFTVKFQSVATPISNAEGIISLETKKGSASNIGIQILNANRQPVVLGQVREVKMASQAGMVQLVYYARYIRTGTASVIAGNADGEVTITTEYK